MSIIHSLMLLPCLQWFGIALFLLQITIGSILFYHLQEMSLGPLFLLIPLLESNSFCQVVKKLIVAKQILQFQSFQITLLLLLMKSILPKYISKPSHLMGPEVDTLFRFQCLQIFLGNCPLKYRIIDNI